MAKTLNITEIEDGLKKIVKNINKNTFILEFLSLYDIPKTSITRAQKNWESSETFTIKNKLHYVEVESNVIREIDKISENVGNLKSKPRYVIANDFTEIAAIDTKTGETLNVLITEIASNADFFLAWNGIEKADYQAENPADRKAAERFARLYDVIEKDNKGMDSHAFNLFLIRILFLLFAEDTGIIKKALFTNTLKTRTEIDGSNLNVVIQEVFEILDIETSKRGNTPDWLLEFPYVNGKLFSEKHIPLNFSKICRELLIEAGELLNWQEINPDILGSMIQSVASAEARHSSGMHYTSVPNIMKVIKPLFLDDLNDSLEQIKSRYEENTTKKITDKTRDDNNRQIIKSLDNLLERISNIKFLDPACGSGNFLIITYKELRRLEIKILLFKQHVEQVGLMPLSMIHLHNFNGIELDDFAHEIAKLSLWIAEHQMNEEMTKAIPGTIAELLPLKEAGNIIQGNALRIDWNEVVPQKDNSEVYVMGNPPYIGSRNQNKEQKEDMDVVFKGIENYKKLDYISAWFMLGAKFIKNTNSRYAFVTTNSTFQGEQVPLLWEPLLKNNIEFIFAYPNFKWTNNAKNSAAVIVSIVGLASSDNSKNIVKKIYFGNNVAKVSAINPYLASGPTIFVNSRSTQINGFAKMQKGNAAYDNGFLTFSEAEYREVINKYPEVKKYMRIYISADDFLADTFKYCLWITPDEMEEAKNSNFILERISSVRKYREASKRTATNKAASIPYAFGEIRYQKKPCVIIPVVSSESRDYIPMATIDEKIIPSYATFTLYDCPVWLLGILQSQMHMIWVKAIGGKLTERYRYSVNLIYNTFPIPELSTQRKKEISRVMLEILDLREYEGGTLAELYHRDTMPTSLKLKHQELDGIVERAYQTRPFTSDDERLSVLLNLYSDMK